DDELPGALFDDSPAQMDSTAKHDFIEGVVLPGNFRVHGQELPRAEGESEQSADDSIRGAAPSGAHGLWPDPCELQRVARVDFDHFEVVRHNSGVVGIHCYANAVVVEVLDGPNADTARAIADVTHAQEALGAIRL